MKQIKIINAVILLLFAIFSVFSVTAEEADPDTLKSDLNWFGNPPTNITTSDYYRDRLVSCTGNYDRLRDILKFDDEQIAQVELQCKNNDYVNIVGAAIPQHIINCIELLEDYLAGKVARIDHDWIIDECLIREEFENSFPDRTETHLQVLYASLNEKLREDMDGMKVIYNSKNDIIPQPRKLNIKMPPDRKRNESYFRNESEDFENFKQELDSAEPGESSRILNEQKGEKPQPLVESREWLNFRGIINKVFGWLPWYKR